MKTDPFFSSSNIQNNEPTAKEIQNDFLDEEEQKILN